MLCSLASLRPPCFVPGADIIPDIPMISDEPLEFASGFRILTPEVHL